MKEAVMRSPRRFAILTFGIFAALIFATCNRAASQTVPGDLTGDGAVTIADATVALQIAIGIKSPSPQQLAAGDLNGDGKLSISEVTQILRAAVRIIKPEDLIQGPIVTTVVGDPVGFADGGPTVARFQDPEEVAVGPDGSIYVADVLNHSIRRIQPDGTTTTVAGTGLPGYKDGPAKQAQFNSPYGIAVDKSGVIYVADSLNRRIRKITPDGMVSTLAGAPEQRDGNFLPDVLDGPPTKARFAFPAGIDVDADGNVYVADFDANRIRKVAPDGTVTTLAGSGIAGFADGSAREARFNGPSGVAVDKNGTVYVADFYNHLIRAISPKGDVFTLSGNPEVDEEGNPLGGYEDGPADTARFDGPASISIGANGVLYVADYYNNRIRRVEKDGSVTTVAGTGNVGSADGPGAEASFYTPNGIEFANGVIYVADSGNDTIRRITSDGTVSTLAGVPSQGDVDGPAHQARLRAPEAIAFDSDGNLYIADAGNNKIRKLSTDGIVSTVAGTGAIGYKDGLARTAQFDLPTGLAVDDAGNIIVADRLNQRIRLITPDGTVSTLAGSESSGYKDGIGEGAMFFNPRNVTIAPNGSIVVIDTYNHRIRSVDYNGKVTTLAGSDPGYQNGPALSARFSFPQAAAFDPEGNLLITDGDNHLIRKLSKDGTVSLFAGAPAVTSGSPEPGFRDGQALEARFALPSGIVVDKNGNVYVADRYNHRIRKIDKDGNVTTIAGTGDVGFTDGPGKSARFRYPIGLAIGPDGALYVSDAGNSRIRKITGIR
jgi:sugar lactone lactonase YvrE